MMKKTANKIVMYFKENAKAERLERRSSKEWAEVGTKEEMATMVRYKERKERNTAIAWVVYLAAAAIGAGATIKAYDDDKKEYKIDEELMRRFAMRTNYRRKLRRVK